MSSISAGTTSTTTLVHSGDTTGSLVFKTNDTGSGGTTAMTIDTSQNVGIGTTTPTATGGYDKAIDLVGGSNGAGLYIRGATSPSTVYASIQYDNYSNRTNINAVGTNNFLRFVTVDTERMRIDSSGNLLVGTTTANGRLSVDSAGTTSATYVIFGRNSAGTNEFSVRSDGAGFINAASWAYGSDLTIKENIEYLSPSSCLSMLLNAKPAKFDYIEGQKSNYGYIAQDVKTWLPDAVTENPNGKLSLQDGFINAISTGALQGLHQLIQELKAINDQQAETINALTARVVTLEGK